MSTFAQFIDDSHVSVRMFLYSAFASVTQFVLLATFISTPKPTQSDVISQTVVQFSFSQPESFVATAMSLLTCAFVISLLETRTTITIASFLAVLGMLFLGIGAYKKLQLISVDYYLEPIILLLIDGFVATMIFFGVIKGFTEPPIPRYENLVED